MQLQTIWNHVPLNSKLTLFWERVTASRLTTFYFAFSVIHFFVQIIFQVQAFGINAQAASFLDQIVTQGNTVDPGFMVLSPPWLYLCEDVPQTLSPSTCQVVWGLSDNNRSDTSSFGALAASGTASSSPSATAVTQYSPEATPATESDALPSTPISTQPPKTAAVAVRPVTTTTKIVFAAPTPTRTTLRPSTVLDHEFSRLAGIHLHPKRDSENIFGQISAVQTDGSLNVTVNGMGWHNQELNLSKSCLWALNWPLEKLDNTKREDITFICFQFWVLGMSVVAILNESIPHIIATLLTHILATAWGGFQIAHTADFRKQFSRFLTNGACKGNNLLGDYWKQRASAEIPSLALNALALLLSAFLSWRLIKLFGWQTFKRVGASLTINRVYRLVLSFSIAILLSLFFIVVSVALFIDQLYHGTIARLASKRQLYEGLLIMVLILTVPWLITGWIAVRRELSLPMFLFLVMSFLYMGGWGAMFVSTTFRWTFIQWLFFALITSASVLLTLSTLLLGIICRFNFGKGLPRYLNAQQPLPEDQYGSEDQKGYDTYSEKVEFPSMARPMPTFSAAFGRGSEVPPPSQMRFGPARLGPRFANQSAEPFDPQPPPNPFEDGENYSHHSSRSVDSITVTTDRQQHLKRQPSTTSRHSDRSFGSDASHDTYHSDYSADQSRRWVIE